MLSWIEHHPSLAAWIEGLGTLAAVLIAAVTAVRQTYVSRREETRRTMEALAIQRFSAGQIVDTIARFVQAHTNSIDSPANLDALPQVRSVDRALQSYYDSFSAIPLLELRDEILAQRIFAMRSHILNVLEMIENLRHHLSRFKSDKDGILARVNSIKQSGRGVAQAAVDFRHRLELLYPDLLKRGDPEPSFSGDGD